MLIGYARCSTADQNLDWQLDALTKNGCERIYREKIKLRLGIRAKNLLLEEYPLASKDLTRNGRHWILETDVYDYAGVCRFYLGLADDIEILDSPELEDYVQEYTRRYIFR